MNVNATSTTASAASSSGLSGMISGMDTDSMVESMLSGIQTQIDTQKQEKQTLEWKQEQYREVITKINDFQDKYFSLTSDTSLRSTSLFNSSTAESTSSAVKIVSADNSAEDEFSVSVSQLATAATVTSSGAVNTNKIVCNDANVKEYKRTVKFNYLIDEDGDGKPDEKDDETFKFGTVDIDFDDADFKAVLSDKKAFAELLNEKLKDTGITIEYTPKDENDEESVEILSFSNKMNFTIEGSTAGLKMLGYSGSVGAAVAEKENESDPDTYTLKSTNYNPEAEMSGSVSISFDGTTKSFTLEEGQSLYDVKDQIEKAFGTGISVTQDADGNTVLQGNGTNRRITVSASDEVLETIGVNSANTSTGFSVSSKLSDLSVSAGKLTINGVDVEYTAEDTVSQVLSKINNSDAGVKISFNSLSNTFTMQNKTLGADFTMTASDNGGFFSVLGFSNSISEKGTNAKITIDGVEMERANNTITYNGVTIEAKAVTTEAANISASKNTDKIMSVIKDFVKDYNTLIEDLNKMTHEKAEYKEYPPLTDAQKKEMTEREIELWEKKSKTGLLRNDSDISKFLQDMRAVFYTKGADSNIVCSNIGIDSSSNWQDYGKLQIDEDTLKKALETKADDIANMFANTDSGLATRLNNVCKQAANTSSGSPGSLVSLAGVVGKATEKDNTIYDQLERIAEKLERLNDRYESRKTKYWKMFNTMENTLSNYQAQSDFLYNNMG